LLAADAGVGDAAIAASVSVGESTVYRTKRRLVEATLNLRWLRKRVLAPHAN
jgi:transposase